MTATALDAGLCLLLVSAAALTVVGVQEPKPPEGRADAAAEIISVTTANVTYTLAPGARAAGASVTAGEELERVAHGTLAELLARAAFRGVEVDGTRLTNTSAAYRERVRRAVLDALPPRTNVYARWEPYPDSHIRGEMTVGPTPPRTGAVDAARLTVPLYIRSPLGDVTVDTRQWDLADRLAAKIIRALFPPERLRFALHDDPPLPALVTYRYREIGQRYGVDTLDWLYRDGPAAANEQLRLAVAERIRADLRSSEGARQPITEFDRIGRVVIVIRTWSP